jgi:hypothetical protein
MTSMEWAIWGLAGCETLFVVSTVANLAAYRHMVTVTWDEYTT